MLAHDFVSGSDRPWHEDLSNGLTVDGEWKVAANGMRDGTVKEVGDDAVAIVPASDGDAVSGARTSIQSVGDSDAGTGTVFPV